MELSLQKKINLPLIRLQRADMVEREVMHIEDKVNYELFLQLYQRYGSNYDEETFARYFLDIDKNKLYYLRTGKVKETTILKREYVSESYLEEIRSKVEAELRQRGTLWISYKRFADLFDKYSGKLNVRMFAEEVLGISEHSIESIKSNGGSRRIFKEKDEEEDEAERYIRQVLPQIRKEVIAKAKLHIDDQITLAKFKALYAKFGMGIPEKVFAGKVLGINNSKTTRLLNGRNATVSVFSNYVVNPDDIATLRERVIQKEHLHIGDGITYDQFIRLFNKYAGMMNQEMFAEEILDVNAIGIKNMRLNGMNALILGDIDIPKEYLEFLKDKIVRREKLATKQEITGQDFDRIYKKYGGVLPQRLFATEVLGISPNSVSSFLLGVYNKTAILYNEEVVDYASIRGKIIRENKFLCMDRINYERVMELRKKYAPNSPETVFADQVLDISDRRYYNIKSNRNGTTYILSREMPQGADLQVFKRKILYENGLHIKDRLNYARFTEIFQKYGGLLPDTLFASLVFDISKDTLSLMKKDPNKGAVILTRTTVPISELKALNERVLSENKIRKRTPITLKDFDRMYTGYRHILSPIMFSRAILGVDKQNLNNLKKGKNASILALKKRQFLEDFSWVSDDPEIVMPEEEPRKVGRPKYIAPAGIISLADKNGQSDKKKARAGSADKKMRAVKILDSYIYTRKRVEAVKEYIACCKEDFQRSAFKEKDLPFLYECIEFVQGRIA